MGTADIQGLFQSLVQMMPVLTVLLVFVLIHPLPSFIEIFGAY